MIYLSPHFDDVVYSCGGLIYEQTQAGQPVQIWTVCAGGPDPAAPLAPFAQELHDRWQTGPQATRQRRKEDIGACARVGALPRHLSVPDCIYRFLPGGVPLIGGLEDLFETDLETEEPLLTSLSAELAASLAPGETLVSPLALGRHIDHRLTRAAAERAAQQAGLTLLYYADYPYVVQHADQLSAQSAAGLVRLDAPISEAGLSAWQAAAAEHVSQISTFWKDEDELRSAFRKYYEEGGGRLWMG